VKFGDRIKFLREKEYTERSGLADKIGLTYHALSKYETSEREPDFQTLIKIADYFNVSTDYLLGRSDELIDSPISYSKLPILGTIYSGIPILAKENIEGYLEVPNDMRADFVLQVKGDSMIGAGILDGDLAICREAAVPENGQIIVTVHDKGSLSEAILKFYMNGNGNPVLRAANPNCADIDYTDGYRTAGIMVALVRKEIPKYQTYKNYIAVPGYEEWAGAIEKAVGAGIKPEHLCSHVDMLIDIGKKIKHRTAEK